MFQGTLNQLKKHFLVFIKNKKHIKITSNKPMTKNQMFKTVSIVFLKLLSNSF